MTFIEAYNIAIAECEFMSHATEIVMDAMRNKTASPCYQFAIGDEAFYFGYDGVDLHAGKHTAKRAAELIRRNETWQIRN